uniref:Uncharacterized protein n=1 Tax=Mandrillus leucophaeus TaxID=9568 RepID=A0A2K5Y963_MANLE
MASDPFSSLHRKFGCVRGRQSPSGLETSCWWMRSPSSPRGPTTCEASTWAWVRISIWELTSATLTSCSGQNPGATLLHCCNFASPASPLPLNLP